MSVYKQTLFFSGGSYGWSESYFLQGSSLIYALTTLQKMANLRMAMYANYIGFAGVRVSTVGAQRASLLLMPGINNLGDQIGSYTLPSAGSYVSAVPETEMSGVRTAMQVRCIYNSNYKAMRYFAGPPQTLGYPTTGGLIPNRHLQWNNLWVAFRDFLLANNYGILARSTVAPYAPSTIASLTVGGSSGSLLGVVLPGASAPPGTPPGQVQISRCRPPKGTHDLSLNGTWMIDSIVTSPTPPSITIYLAGSAGILPSAVRLTPKSTCQVVNNIFYAFQAMNFMRIGIHKRGRPSLAPRGRQLKRVTLDP